MANDKKPLAIPLTDDQRALIDRAARLSGLAPTTFARRSLLRRAELLIEKHQRRNGPLLAGDGPINGRVLSPEAWAMFCEALEMPPAANDGLRRAVQRQNTAKQPTVPSIAS